MPSTVAVTAAPVASSLMYQVDQSLRTLGFDLKSLVKSFDLQTVGLLTLLVVVGIFLFDFLNYGYSSYYGDTSTYTSYGRSLVTTAAKIWDQRDELGVNPYVRGGRGLDSMTQILDSLADAVLKYEEYESNDVDRTRESKDL
ncbi:uncharacterized protein [Panulirus ornatus]|uniref:uncharacterized protein n=1 Tax=Panulirus ornatus TaxID=150431 RepID=UPI003A88DBE7